MCGGKIEAGEGEDAGDADPMTFEEICAILVNEPFYLSLAQISRLTDYQIWQIYFRPKKKPERDMDRPAPRGERIVASPFMIYWVHEHQRGKADQEIIDRWLVMHPERMAEAVVSPQWHRDWPVKVANGSGPEATTP